MILQKLLFILVWQCFTQGTLTSALDTPMPHPDCPQFDDINNPKLLPYPGECNKYYSCVNGLAYPQNCPDNFHFSRLASRCEYPEKAMCPWQTIPSAINANPTSTEVITSPATNPFNPLPETIYQLYPNDCNRYYKCEAMSCPSNYHWNFQQQRCDFPHIAQCPFRPIILPPTTIIPTAATPVPATIIPTAATAPPTEPSNVIPALPIGTSCSECYHLCMGQGHIYLPYPGDCRKFIQCNGLAFVHNCPNDLLWNDNLKTCDRFCIVNNE